MKHIMLIVAGCSSLFLIAPPAHAGVIDLAAEIAKLKDLFKSNGFGKPVIDILETPRTFEMLIISTQEVDTKSSFTTKFVSNYWRGALTFSQTDPFRDDDTLSAVGFLRHWWQPHEGEGIGPAFKFQLSVNAESTFQAHAGSRDHGHKDSFFTELRATADPKENNILQWSLA